MVVRVARQAHASGAQRCVVAADDLSIVRACEGHGVEALLTQYGIEKGRFHWGWISGAEAPQWAQLARDFTDQVRTLGPLDWKRQLASKEE